MPTFTGKNTDNLSLKEHIEIIGFRYSFVDDEYLPDRDWVVQEAQQRSEVAVPAPVYGYAFFQLLLTFVPLKLVSDVVYPFKVMNLA
jgi:hypothetical protein